MKKFMKQLKNERGLTLVELLAVVVILAIVGAIAVVAIGNVMENSRKDAHIANAQQVISATQLYDASGGLAADATSVATSELKSAELLDSLIDPWTKTEDGYDFSVSISGGNVHVTSNKTECSFTNADKVDLAGDRENVCGKSFN